MSTSLTNHYMLFTLNQAISIEQNRKKISNRNLSNDWCSIAEQNRTSIELYRKILIQFDWFVNLRTKSNTNQTSIENQSNVKHKSNSIEIYRVFLLFDWCSIAFDFFRLAWQSNFLIDIAWTKILFHSVYGVVKCCSI